MVRETGRGKKGLAKLACLSLATLCARTKEDPIKVHMVSQAVVKHRNCHCQLDTIRIRYNAVSKVSNGVHVLRKPMASASKPAQCFGVRVREEYLRGAKTKFHGPASVTYINSPLSNLTPSLSAWQCHDKYLQAAN